MQWLHGCSVVYSVVPIVLGPFNAHCSIAFSSACSAAHSNKSFPLSYRLHILQCFTPDAGPLYPVATILLFFTNIAPSCLFRQWLLVATFDVISMKYLFQLSMICISPLSTGFSRWISSRWVDHVRLLFSIRMCDLWFCHIDHRFLSCLVLFLRLSVLL